jgi:3',5'-cyclic AMP phosphodiesterase CpdA
LVAKINGGQFPAVALVFITGDIVSSLYDSFDPENPESGTNRLRKAVDIMSELEKPCHFVLGNHDYKIDRERDSDTYFPENEILDMEKIWKDQAGVAPYHRVDFQGWRFIVLNSMRGRHLFRFFDDQQLEWLQSQLKESKPTVLFFHHPLKTDRLRIWCKPRDLIDAEKEPLLYSILQKNREYIKGIFVGHGHRWLKDTLFETIGVYQTGSFGDSKQLSFNLAGFDTTDYAISVRRIEIQYQQN